ncbi:MAG TPA: hypothetical protein VEW65_11075 [Chryseolinea sp.]|nr:hypothetical protein [Chryseolinea sp.]
MVDTASTATLARIRLHLSIVFQHGISKTRTTDKLLGIFINGLQNVAMFFVAKLRLNICQRDSQPVISQEESTQFFSQFISINASGKVIVAVDAEEKIRNHFTTYANQAQEKFYNDVSSLLRKLSEIESKFNVPGLTATAIGQNDGEYFFQCQHLTFVKHG